MNVALSVDSRHLRDKSALSRQPGIEEHAVKGRFVAVVAAAGILALSGCSSGSAEQPGDATSSPPVVTGPPSIVAPTPVPPTRPTAEASTSSVQAYCQTVQGYQKEATEAINQLLKQPQSVQANLARLQSARDQLRGSAADGTGLRAEVCGRTGRRARRGGGPGSRRRRAVDRRQKVHHRRSKSLWLSAIWVRECRDKDRGCAVNKGSMVLRSEPSSSPADHEGTAEE